MEHGRKWWIRIFALVMILVILLVIAMVMMILQDTELYDKLMSSPIVAVIVKIIQGVAEVFNIFFRSKYF